MAEYEFILKFRIPHECDMSNVVERLGAEGCTDAVVGIGIAGRLAADFCREAEDAESALESAIADVKRAVPDTQFVEACPDLVGLTDIADLVDVSRQNMRKLMTANAGFPLPVHDGSTALWHLHTVLHWLTTKKGYDCPKALREIAAATMKVNLREQASRYIESDATAAGLRRTLSA